MRANAANRLLAHYRETARELPWRAMPGETPTDPYRVWLSEIMLQQTSVAAVTPRFERFVSRWPTVEQLAAAPGTDVLSEWAGLGYYARARNLIACAKIVAARGGFPTTESELRALPGIGSYTAAAIAAIAFGQRSVVIDTNVERIIARLHAIDLPIAEARPQIRKRADAMTPEHGAGDFAQAMMDLGATICRPRSPDCPACPLIKDCAAFASGNPEAFPARSAKRERPLRHGIARWIEREGMVWLVRRPSRGMLGGMAALPGPEWSDDPLPIDRAPLARLRHVFTHFALDLTVVTGSEPLGDGWWQPLDRIGEAGLPTLYRRAADLILARRTADLAA
jgi:A/G-specific adenine glycosylase